jgi:DNA-directed RNA polymerase subunit RPC12/RpoP
MSEIKDFFRHCPSCGRRFHIKLVSKTKINEEVLTEHMTQVEQEMSTGLIHANPMYTPLAEGQAIFVDIREFQYNYKCTHCGHQWSEVHEEEQSTTT